MRRYPHALRDKVFARCYGPLMPIDFDQAQPAIAGRLQAWVVTKCRKTDPGTLHSFEYGEIWWEFQRTPIERDVRERGRGRSIRLAPSRDIANSRLLQHGSAIPD